MIIRAYGRLRIVRKTVSAVRITQDACTRTLQDFVRGCPHREKYLDDEDNDIRITGSQGSIFGTSKAHTESELYSEHRHPRMIALTKGLACGYGTTVSS